MDGTNGRDGESGCVVEPGYEGKATKLDAPPWVTSTISAAACTVGTTGTVPGTTGTGGASGCVVDTDSFVGSVTAETFPPYYSSSICASGSTCCAAGEFADPDNNNDCRACEAGK